MFVALATTTMTARAGTVTNEPVAGPQPPHNHLACRSCHVGAAAAGKQAAFDCTAGDCHADVATAFHASPHDRSHTEEIAGAPRCPDCHGGHVIATGTQALAIACAKRLDLYCLGCHDVSILALRQEGAPPTASLAGAADVHSAAIRARGCASTPLSCYRCHGAHAVLPLENPDSPVARSRIAATCGACHAEAQASYATSVHARGVESGDDISPTCVSCHGSHSIRPAHAGASPTAAAEVVFTCARCHEDPTVLRKARLAYSMIDRYEHTFHGMAYGHGISDVANCVSCHGAHDVVPAADPRSPVNSANLVTTCNRCHTQVTGTMIAAVAGPSTWTKIKAFFASLRLYFPLAGTSVNPFLVSGMGALVGFLSGLFGVGGGFLMTPLLIFIGIPAAVAAATDAAQISAGATSGAVSHSRLGNVDFKMGLTIVVGGWTGGYVGVQLVHALRNLGNFDFFLKLVYVLILGFIGVTMLLEGIRTLRGRSGSSEPGPSRLTMFFARLPLQMTFPKSGLRTSVLLPIAAGFLVGVLAAFLGVGGGFIMLPAMIYIIGIPTRVAVGTDLFQIVLTSANVTLQQAVVNHTVDLLLAVALFAGSTIGAQFGVVASRYLKGEQIRVFLAMIVLVVMSILLYQLLSTPGALIAFAKSGGGH
jgi:uncharacterized membrane protein YfcA